MSTTANRVAGASTAGTVALSLTAAGAVVRSGRAAPDVSGWTSFAAAPAAATETGRSAGTVRAGAPAAIGAIVLSGRRGVEPAATGVRIGGRSRGASADGGAGDGLSRFAGDDRAKRRSTDAGANGAGISDDTAYAGGSR